MRRHVLLHLDSVSGFGRGVMFGIARYATAAGGWRFAGEVRLGTEPGAVDGRWRGDGVSAHVTSDKTAEALAAVGCPVVNVGAILRGVGFPTVRSDDRAAGRTAADHLFDRGLRRVACCGFGGHGYSDDRIAGVLDAAGRAGVTVDSVECGALGNDYWSFDEDRRRLRTWLAALPKPAGVIAANDVRAAHVLEACRDVGAKVPEDIAVVGVGNDDPLCDMTDPPLTSVELDLDGIGYRAAALLDAMIDGRPPPEPTVRLPPVRVVTRRSTELTGTGDAIVDRALVMIAERAAEGAAAGDIIAALPLSRRAVERRFKAATGRTIHAELRRQQIDRAKRLLVETDLTMPEIADRCGLPDGKRLSLVFKDETGETATAYRRRLRSSVSRSR